jgi:hypothetical protein
LRVIQVDYRLGDVHSRTSPEYRPIGPRIGSIDDHAEALVRRVLYQHRAHLLKDALRNFVLLILRVITRVLHLALQRLLFLLDLLYKRSPAVVIQLVALGVELLLQGLYFVVHSLEFGLLGLELLAQSLKVTLAFVGGEDGLLDIDRPHPGSGSVGGYGSGGIVGSSAGSRG